MNNNSFELLDRRVFPQHTDDMLPWMRKASSDDLANWIHNDQNIFHKFAPTLSLLQATISKGDRSSVLLQCSLPENCKNIWGFARGGVICSAVDEASSLLAALNVGPNQIGPTQSASFIFSAAVKTRKFFITAKAINTSMSSVSISARVGSRRVNNHSSALLVFSRRKKTSNG